MAIDVYLQIDGIKGDSTDAQHKGLDRVRFGELVRVPAQKRDGVQRCGHTAERCELSDISFSKLADMASPVLLQMCAGGKTKLCADRRHLEVPLLAISLPDELALCMADWLGNGAYQITNINGQSDTANSVACALQPLLQERPRWQLQPSLQGSPP